ncbi:MAG: SUF system NifU family Fe-S cluster assembly protein [Planctomycetes bacterium]|nr:SUF system NifU family Fe-S cluster assembly protein [Planctomycetota bacterium]
MDLQELYQELILDHNRQPRNRGVLECGGHEADGYNPLCGDRVHVTVELDGDVIKDIRFEGSGCAISTASASIMSEAVKGKTLTEAKYLFEQFITLVTEGPEAVDDPEDLGKLAAFAGVGKYPARVKCATLAWHTLTSALKGEEDTVTTE